MDLFLDAFAHLEKNPAFWLCLTLSFYVLGQVIFKAAKFNPFLSPIIISVVCLISFLVATGVPYETYFSGANFIHFLLSACRMFGTINLPLERACPTAGRSPPLGE